MTRLDYSKLQISTELLIKIFSRITIKDMGYHSPCWIWGNGNPNNYGQFRIAGLHYVAHRVLYCLFVEYVEHPLHVDHLCRIKRCCNPVHLEAVTGRENTLRGVSPIAQNARKTHCDKGHALTEDNVWLVGEHKRFRVCRQCALAYRRRHKTQQRGYPVRPYVDSHCLRGHERTLENTRVRPDGFRECRPCQRMKRNEWRAKRKAMGLPRD